MALNIVIEDIVTCALSSDSRKLFAVIGVPASGKTTVATLLTKLANERIRHMAETDPEIAKLCVSGDLVQLIPMDGFHLTRETLRNRQPVYPSDYCRESNDPQDPNLYFIDGCYRPWPSDVETCFARRGAHWTFDADSFAKTLQKIRTAGPNDPPILVPGWDHATKDPDWDAISVSNSARVVIVEGLYCLLDIVPWNKATECIDRAILVECDETEVRLGNAR